MTTTRTENRRTQLRMLHAACRRYKRTISLQSREIATLRRRNEILEQHVTTAAQMQAAFEEVEAMCRVLADSLRHEWTQGPKPSPLIAYAQRRWAGLWRGVVENYVGALPDYHEDF